MPLHLSALPNIVILSGASTGNAVKQFDGSQAMTLYAPAALTGTITVEVEPTSTGTSFVTLQSGGSDVTIAAGKAIVLNYLPFSQLRLVSGAAEGADRTFKVTLSSWV